jgi:hypothetical protein
MPKDKLQTAELVGVSIFNISYSTLCGSKALSLNSLVTELSGQGFRPIPYVKPETCNGNLCQPQNRIPIDILSYDA